ncbi:hypothetical protein [Anaerosporobacter sp.]|uniref:hypothetical protein n=1 Tax=Anaerosporobacter sp. TaxID=1872529 RepID=UPI00286F380D|nr:hypothetical protein [Anaerosporobacter sp.]
MNDKVTLPKSWQNKFKSEKLKDAIADIGMWFQAPDPMSVEGRARLKRNEAIFLLAESLSVDYAFEPNENGDFELIPASVEHQGIGFSVSSVLEGVELDVYFFPCDYSEDSRRKLPPYSVRVPVASTANIECVKECVEQYFSMYKDKRIASIPFSFSRVATLEGNFIDDFAKTRKICKDAVAGGEEYEIENCKRFLEFIKSAGIV